MISRAKHVIRASSIALLVRAMSRSRDAGVREALWRRIRLIDDRLDTHSRRLMKEIYDIEIGHLTYGAFKVDGAIAPGTSIGAYCSVAPGVRIGGDNHPLHFVTTHAILYMGNRGFVAQTDEELHATLTVPPVLEDDVWVGVNAVILPGVRVGRGAVVGAGAVVTRDVEPYMIVGGVPAKPIRRRFPDETADRLAAIDWPSWDPERIRAELDSFYDVDGFVERHGRDGSGPR